MNREADQAVMKTGEGFSHARIHLPPHMVRERQEEVDRAVARMWANPTNWPYAIEYTFLAEAILLIGSKMFPDWQDTEAIYTGVGAPHRRLTRVFHTIRDWASRGDLAIGVRIIENGPIWKSPPEDWLTEGPRLFTRFVVCRIIPDEPLETDAYRLLDHAKYGTQPQWLFVRTEDLQRLLGSDLARVSLPSGHGSSERTIGARSKPGPKSMVDKDRPFLVRMGELIESGSATSPQQAAMLVAHAHPRPPGGGSPQSIATRLAKNYRRVTRQLLRNRSE